MGSQRVGHNLGTEQLKQQSPNLPILPRLCHKSHPTLVLQHQRTAFVFSTVFIKSSSTFLCHINRFPKLEYLISQVNQMVQVWSREKFIFYLNLFYVSISPILGSWHSTNLVDNLLKITDIQQLHISFWIVLDSKPILSLIVCMIL